jgi:hypothetical protein
MSKSEQVQKCLNLALDNATTEAEAITAFKTARRLNLKLDKPIDYNGSSSSDTFSSTTKISNFPVKDTIELINLVSHITEGNDTRALFDVTGMVFKPTIDITVTGIKSNVKSVMRKIDTFYDRKSTEDDDDLFKPREEKSPYDHSSDNYNQEDEPTSDYSYTTPEPEPEHDVSYVSDTSTDKKIEKVVLVSVSIILICLMCISLSFIL